MLPTISTSAYSVTFAWICPLVAFTTISMVYAFSGSALLLFLALGTAILISLLGISFSIILLIQNKQSWIKTFIFLAANASVAAFSAIWLLGVIVIGIGFAV
jgi:hypothetical protein